MHERAGQHYKGHLVTASARRDPIAGDGVQTALVYRALAVVRRDGVADAAEVRIEDPKGQVFADAALALKVALALAKRHIDARSDLEQGS
jgi:hypothetical protein